MIPFLPWLLACKPEVAEDVRQLLGTVSAYESALEVWDGSSYFYADDETMVLYMNQADDLSCAQTAATLARASIEEADFDPDLAMLPGYCTLTVSTGTWLGEVDVALAPGETTADAIVSLYCPLPGGEWQGEEGTYTFDGEVWIGVPDGYTLHIEGGEEGGTFEIAMDTYTGSDPDVFGSDYPGTGDVAGAGNVEWCAEFEDTPLFP